MLYWVFYIKSPPGIEKFVEAVGCIYRDIGRNIKNL